MICSRCSLSRIKTHPCETRATILESKYHQVDNNLLSVWSKVPQKFVIYEKSEFTYDNRATWAWCIIPSFAWSTNDTVIGCVPIWFKRSPCCEVWCHSIVLPEKISLCRLIIETKPECGSNPVWNTKNRCSWMIYYWLGTITTLAKHIYMYI